MARIQTYERDLVLSRNDILIGSDAENSNVTRNFSVGSLIDFISLESGGVVDTNYYLSAITVDQTSGVVTFTMTGRDDHTLTLGTAAFASTSDFAASDVSFTTAQIVSENDITAYYLNVSGNGDSGQLLASDGDGSFSWVDSASITDTNNYLTGITKSGEVLTFNMQGDVNDPTFTFGEAAFLSTTNLVNTVKAGLSIEDIDTTALGTLAYKDAVQANDIISNSITTLKISDDNVTEPKLKISNNPTAGYALTSDGGDGFTWAANSTSNYYLTSVTRNNSTLTFDLGGGFTGTDPTFTFGDSAFFNVQSTQTDRNSQKIAKADHLHDMSHISDSGDLAELDSVGTGNIDNSAVTAVKLSPSIGVAGQVLSLDSNLDLTWVASGGGSASFTALSDTPNSYTANAGDILKVNSGINGLEFSAFAIANIGQITSVNQGTSGKVLAVAANNQGSSGYKGLEWIDTSQVGATTFTALTDTPASIGTANQLLTVNAAGTDLEFRALDANHISTGLITSTMISDGTITGTDIAAGTIASGNIATGAVGANQLGTNSVTTIKISNANVTADKLANNAVTTDKITDLNVTTDKLANGSVTEQKLATINTIGSTNTKTEWDTVNDTSIDWYVNGNNEMRLEADGDLHVDGDVVAFSSTVASDQNLKRDIKNISDPIDKIKKLNGVTFNWARNGKSSAGVIAQDVKEVMPSLVSSVQGLNDSASHLAVDYNGIIGLLIETVKEQQNQIDTLKAKLQA